MKARNHSFTLALIGLLSSLPAMAAGPLYFSPPPAAPSPVAADQPPPPAASPSAAPSAPEPDMRLSACLERARLDPDGASAVATAWAAEEGGPAAELCGAMAQFHAGAFVEAAQRLEKLAAARPPAENAAAARLLAQAGWAWLRAGKPDQADQRYSAALEKRADDADLWIDRAFARAEAERYWDAIADLEKAMALAPDRAEPFTYRAAAHHALGQTHLALADLGRALELRPNDPAALLLRGNIRAATGDWAAAAADWTQVTTLEPADGVSARAAADNLEKLRRKQKK